MRDKKESTAGRRDFLISVAAIGTGAALATPMVTPAQADSESDDEKRKARYQETDHIKTYYRVNSYPR